MQDRHSDASSSMPDDDTQEVTGFPFGQYMAMPLAEQAADGTWRAAVAISGGEPGAQRPDKCAFPQTFFSHDEALKFATDQCELQSSGSVVGA
jgi:alpha/beta superfamily hydrolase